MTSARRRLAAVAMTATVAAGTVLSTGSASAAAEPAPVFVQERCYLAAIHEIFLDRPASVYDLETWTNRYEPAPARPAAARLMAVSDEWLAAVVTGIYDTALDRGPDPGGLAFWIGRLRAGVRVTTLTAQVYGSDEVWARGGSTPEGFVEDVYPRIMGREASPDDVEYWAGELGHQGPGDVAKRLLGSIENRRSRVTALYQEILGRQPDTGGRDYWAGRLATLDDVTLAVHLASSLEAYQRAQAGCEVPPPATLTQATEGDRSSMAPQISADGRYVAFLSRASNLVPGDVQDSSFDMYLLDRDTSTITKVPPPFPGYDLGSPGLSADGRHVVFSTTNAGAPDIFTWDRVTNTTTRVSDDLGSSTGQAVSADGRFIAYASHETIDPSSNHGVYVWDRTTAETELVTSDVSPSTRPVMSPDGSYVALMFQERPVPAGEDLSPDAYLWTRETDSIEKVADDSFVHGVTDEGDVILSVWRGGGLFIVDGVGDEPTVTVVPEDVLVDDARLAADGATMAFSSPAPLVPEDGDTEAGTIFDAIDAYVWERATGTFLRLTSDASVGNRPSVSADGRVIAFQDSPMPIGQPGNWSNIVVWDRGS